MGEKGEFSAELVSSAKTVKLGAMSGNESKKIRVILLWEYNPLSHGADMLEKCKGL